MRLKACVRAPLLGFIVLASLILFAGGCGDGAAAPGTVAKPAEQQGKRYREMEDFMKNPPKDQKPGK